MQQQRTSLIPQAWDWTYIAVKLDQNIPTERDSENISQSLKC